MGCKTYFGIINSGRVGSGQNAGTSQVEVATEVATDLSGKVYVTGYKWPS